MYKCGLQKYTQTQFLFFLSLRARLFLVNFNLTFDFLNCSEHSAISDNNIILLHGKEHGKTYASNLQNGVILKWLNILYFFSIKIRLTNLIQISLKRYFRNRFFISSKFCKHRKLYTKPISGTSVQV